MPQLDQFTYLSQFIWLCFFYMTFYVLLVNDGLPKISRIFKLRAYLLSQQNSGTSQEEQKNLVESSSGTEKQDIVFQTLHQTVSYVNSTVTGAFHWCKKSVDNLNTHQLKSMNKSYLRSIGEITLSQNIKNSALEASAPIPFVSHSSLPLEISRIWTLRVQKCVVNSRTKKKKKK